MNLPAAAVAASAIAAVRACSDFASFVASITSCDPGWPLASRSIRVIGAIANPNLGNLF